MSTRMTKTQLVDENIRLRAECDRLERERQHWYDTACREQQAAGEYLMRAERAEAREGRAEEQLSELQPAVHTPRQAAPAAPKLGDERKFWTGRDGKRYCKTIERHGARVVTRISVVS